MEKNKVSVIIPAYNAECYIERCIKSILEQTYKNLEIIVVDDGSIDSTSKILDKIAKTDSRIMVIHKKNEGVSIARNVALEKVTGEYVMFTDSDDWLENTMVSKLLNNAEENDSDIVICSYKNYYENEKKFEEKIVNKKNYSKFLSLITDDTTNAGGFPWNKLMKRKCITKGYNPSVHYFENLLFFLENFDEVAKFSIEYEPLYNYSINDTSALHSKKYSIKKISGLDALNLVIPLLPTESLNYHKFLYINNYFENLYYIRKNSLNKNLLSKYVPNLKKFYTDVMNSRNVSVKIKIKSFILYRLNFIYFLIKKIKKQ